VLLPSELARRFGFSELIGHFVLHRSDVLGTERWPERSAGAWRLSHHPSLPVSEIVAPDGTFLGWIVGYAIDPGGRLAGSRLTAPGPGDNGDGGCFESWLYTLGGRFVAIRLGSSPTRLYLDAGGSLGVVFCPRQEIVASSPFLVPYAEGCEDHLELIRALGIPQADGYYPFGLTPRHGVERLLPGHFLDLEAWRPARHWPLGEIPSTRDVAEMVDTIAETLKRHIGAIASAQPVHMSLTAGRDTRMLLACAREHLDRIRFFTLPSPDWKAELDVDIARRIARRFGLDHVCLESAPATEEDLARWVYRTGCSVGEVRGWRSVRSFNRLGSERPWLSGLGGEVARSIYRRREDAASSPLGSRALLERFSLPAHPELLARGQAWLAELPVRNSFTILDLAYLEQRLGCWASPLSHAFPEGCAFQLNPFYHRRIFEAMLSLPADYRLEHRLADDLVRSQWKQLLRFSFNEPMGLRSYPGRAQRLVGRVRHKAKALLGGRLGSTPTRSRG
jgi:hypothetical protein